ncbi:flagellar motor switch protein FliN [Pararhizobium sp.]|uniref:flagellar motor switch protein FliN n=1 Tax=Pararhizobium sp. TaxID=1977563 RepID=UPI00271A5D74|nr:flagellar motor switch protein FliN [Pararhizobium sp.]MDO9416073.1 flagellar motor switch protein FliN [Pararhizobium sp.]
MAPKKAPQDDMELPATGEMDLDQAIDDLRGVLKQDAGGLGSETAFGSDFDASAGDMDLSAFGGDFGTETVADTSGLGDFGSTSSGSTDFGTPAESFGSTAFESPSFKGSATAAPGSSLTANHDLIMDIPIDVQIVLGQSRMQVSGLMNLTEGATIALDRRIGEPVEIVVNGRLIGRGEITVLEEDETRFGVRIIEVNSTRKI